MVTTVFECGRSMHKAARDKSRKALYVHIVTLGLRFPNLMLAALNDVERMGNDETARIVKS